MADKQLSKSADINEAKSTLTSEQKHQAKIAVLTERLKNEKQKLRAKERKKRNGQLIALGLYFEYLVKTWSQENINKHLSSINKHFSKDERRLKLALDGVQSALREKKIEQEKFLKKQAKQQKTNEI